MKYNKSLWGGRKMKIARKIERIENLNNVVSIHTNAVEIRIYGLTDNILRIRAGFDGDFAEESYDLTMTAWEDRMDEYMKDYRTRVELKDIEVVEVNDNLTEIRTGNFRIEATHEPFMFKIYDVDGRLLHEDIPERGWLNDSNNRRIHTCVLDANDHFYGFGERTGELDKRNKFMSMAPGDTMGYNPVETDPLYKHFISR